MEFAKGSMCIMGSVIFLILLNTSTIFTYFLGAVPQRQYMNTFRKESCKIVGYSSQIYNSTIGCYTKVVTDSDIILHIDSRGRCEQMKINSTTICYFHITDEGKAADATFELDASYIYATIGLLAASITSNIMFLSIFIFITLFLTICCHRN